MIVKKTKKGWTFRNNCVYLLFYNNNNINLKKKL